jgi:MFS family permease
LATAAAAMQPRESLGIVKHLSLASFWFGLNFHWTPILGILVAARSSELLQGSQAILATAILFGLGAVFAMVLPPAVGFYSDRLTTRFGRRRPIMVIGTAGNIVGLLVMAVAPSFALFLVAYLVVQIFNNSAGAAFNGVIPDVVPKEEFGKASGFLGGLYQVGGVAGLIVTLLMEKAGLRNLTFVVIAVVLGLSLLPTVWAAAGEGLVPIPPKPRQPFMVAARAFFRPLWAGDFGWVVFTRLLITGGIWLIYPFVFFFFRDVVKAPNADQFTTFWQLLLVAAAIPLGVAGGWLSDRIGRKIFVYASGALQSLVVVLFIVLYPTSTFFVLALGVVYGVGYGLYYAVDWALACDTLPNAEETAKDMGLFHVAVTLPQVLLPSIAGFVLFTLNRQSPNSGYRVVFAGAIVFYLLGTVLVSRIKSVR